VATATPLALILLTAVTLGTVAWAMREFRIARNGRVADRQRRMALYHALLLDSFGMAFTIILLTRLWPGLPPQLALFGLAPGFTAALAVRFHDGFAEWLLDQIGQ
jgi:uncharacterized membrane-anchored protein